MVDATAVLGHLPNGLRDELLESFEEIASRYAEHRWESAELNGGKFCEVVYTILHGALTGTYAAKASKPTKMLQACQALEQIPKNTARVGDHSLRILIPRLLPALYDIRNNRGVGHVGGDVNPNYLDATAVYGMSSWILAELIRVFHNISTQEAQDVVDTLVERKHPLIWDIGHIRRVMDAKMKPKDQTLVLLHGKPGWVSAGDLWQSVEYSTMSNFRSQILAELHKNRLIEFDRKTDAARISPLGVADVEKRILATKK